MSDTVMLVGTLIPIAAILIGGLLILVPVAGLTLRFALKPALEAYAKMREIQGQEQEIGLLQQRVALLEEQVHLLTRPHPAPPAAPSVQVGQIARPEGPAQPRAAVHAQDDLLED